MEFTLVGDYYLHKIGHSQSFTINYFLVDDTLQNANTRTGIAMLRKKKGLHVLDITTKCLS